MLNSLSILGIVFALVLFLIAFSAIILYIAFRVKEALREEEKRGVTVVKVAFLIGTLFLAGGGLYFFGRVITQTPSETEKPRLTLTVTYPSRVRIRSKFTVTFTIINPTETTVHDVTIHLSMLLEQFSVESSSHKLVGNVIEVGEAPPGTMICQLNLISPTKPTKAHETVTLTYREMSKPITQEIEIAVTGKP
ncbi:hypothetical protein J7K52_04330 [Candidatus Bathyarchaeota archaeon]|nr:hypothetical protein [Candidatus Bathyarchaeota archaeon]